MSSPRVSRDVPIALSDGTVLAGDLWLPADERPAPAVLSMTAYGKDHLGGSLMDAPHRHFAEHGYASLLVDLRGLGNSSGIPRAAIDPADGEDAAAVVEWMARQPWCDGNVGAWGMSWGAVTTFQVAAVQPEALKAVVPIMGFLDAYDDWVYPGGCQTCMVPVGWACQHLLQQLMPPLTDDCDRAWFERWTQRLENIRPYLLPWREHTENDEFWRALAIPSDRIRVPTFLIGGWRDMCSEGIIRAFERIAAPRKLLMGPWGHALPDSGGEAVDYLELMCRWWDRWLRPQSSRVDPEPPVTIFVQGRGQWRDEPAWPLDRAETRALWLADGLALTERPSMTRSVASYRGDPTVGVASGRWDSLGTPLEQATDDLRALTYTGAPLVAELEVAGRPQAVLHLSADDGEAATLVVRLCDVGPDGRSRLITSGSLLAPVGADRLQRLVIPLYSTAYAVPAGHRLRVSISCADFPHLWPTGSNPRIHVHHGAERSSHVELPVVAGTGRTLSAMPCRPEASDAEGSATRRVEWDVRSGAVAVTSQWAQSPEMVGGRRTSLGVKTSARLDPGRPGDARVVAAGRAAIVTPAGSRIKVSARAWASLAGFSMWGRVKLDGAVLFERTWRSDPTKPAGPPAIEPDRVLGRPRSLS